MQPSQQLNTSNMEYSFIRTIGECLFKPFNFMLKSHIADTVTGMILQKNVLVVRYMTVNIVHNHQKQANIRNQISVLCKTGAQIQNTALRKSSNEFEIELHPEHMEALHSFSSS